MKIGCLEFMQHGETMYVGKVRLKDFFSMNYKIDEWKPALLNDPEHQGYQRTPEAMRAKRFGKFISSKNISPPAIYLAIRDADSKLVQTTKNVKTGMTELDIDRDCPVYIVDGQHRIRGLEDTDVGGKFADFELPFVMMFGKSKFFEAEQFVIINKTHKVVRTDLAERFVQAKVREQGQSIVANDPNIGIYRNSAWINKALNVLDALNGEAKNGNIWHYKIRLPNESRGTMTTVSQKSFTDSLKTLLDPATDSPLSHVDDEGVVDTLGAFWLAIKEVCPEPFEDPDKSGDYSIQSTIGVMSLHRVLSLMYKAIGYNKLKKEHFKKILDIDGIKNPDYWSRTLEIDGSEMKGGRWTRMGTNNKSFRIIADEIMLEIKESDEFKHLAGENISAKVS